MKIKNKKILFVFDVLIFVLIFFVLDSFTGMIMKKLFYMQKEGTHYWITYSMDKSNEDIVIFGSSHCYRHYDPDVFQKTLNLTCLNTGGVGQGIVFINAVQEELIKRYNPKIIILNLDYNFMYKTEYGYERLSQLLPYVNEHDNLKQIITNRNFAEKYKVILNSYIYNSTIINILKNLIIPKKKLKGFSPFYGVIKEDTASEKRDIYEEHILRTEKEVIDSNCVSVYRSFIENSIKTGARVYLVLSPTYLVYDFEKDRSFMMMKNIAKEYGLEILDYSRNPLFNGKNELFNDYDHLNYNGAELFSQEVANKIKNDIESNTSTTNQEK